MEEMGALCLATDPDDEGRVCINPVGHRGRHRDRPLTEIVGLPNWAILSPSRRD